MKLLLCASMQFKDEINKAARMLEDAGHVVQNPGGFELWGEHGREKGDDGELEFTREYELMRTHYDKVKQADAMLVLNYEKNGVPGYIGGGVLMEMGFAHVLRKPIFLLNQVPDLPYRDEIELTDPTVLEGDLKKIPLRAPPEEMAEDYVRAGTMKRVQTFDANEEENGFLMELLKDGRFTRAYMTCVYPHSFKGYHLHRVRATNYVAVRGVMKVVLFIYKKERWAREEHILDSAKGDALHIPANVATGFMSATDEEACLINFPEPAYDPELKGEQVEYTEEEFKKGIVK